MQVVILCGGKGTRLSEYTDKIPKPLVTIGDKPILHHLMGLYASHGHKDFILCLGHMGNKIREHFNGSRDGHKEWNIIFADTGEDTTKAERLAKIRHLLKEDNFLVAYGDDLSDVDVNEVVEAHKNHGKIVTMTAVPMISPFGIVEFNGSNEVTRFKEKPRLNDWMCGGFYVMSKKIFDFIKPGYDLEKETFDDLVKHKQIAVFRHEGFWKSMNTLKDVLELNEIYKKGNAPWIK